MKKLFSVFLVVFLMVGAGSASAMPWNWDLSTVGIEASTDIGANWSSSLHYDNFMGFINPGTQYTKITQSFAGGANNTVLDNGDIFSEIGFLSEINADSEPVGFRDAVTHAQRRVYFEFSGLSGTIANYNSGADAPTSLANYATNLGDDSFDLNFTPGLGTIKLYVDSDFNSGNGVIDTLAELTLLSGVGTSPELLINQAEGQFNILTGFTSVKAGMWSFQDGTTFEDWMTAFGIPSIFLSSFNLGATVKGIGDDGTNLLFDVFNHGDFQISAVPEPGTIILLGLGLLSLAGLGRKRFVKN